MGNSDSSKPGARPGGNPPPAGSSAANTKPTPTAANTSEGKTAGRIIHDERGNAVWDWLKDTARIAIDSTSRLLMRLEVPDLKVEDTQEQELRMEADRDAGGGYDPYGGSGSTSGRNAPSARTSGASTSAKSRGTTFENVSTNKGTARSNTSNNTGGGYDPYGKSATTKPTRKP